MKKVIVYAYLHFNLGDDLFIRVLGERYPNTNFVLYAPKGYKEVFKNYPNIKVYPSDSFWLRGLNGVLTRIGVPHLPRRLIAKDCDAAVFIGGSLFIQNRNFSTKLREIKYMKRKNQPFYLLGANFGPYKDEQFYIQYKELFRTYTDICFREKYSYELFKDLENVRVADDLIFQLQAPIEVEKKNHIVMSVIKPSSKQLPQYDDIYYEKMKEAAVCFIKHGYKVILMSFCEFEGDREAVAEIENRIPSEYRNHVDRHHYKLNMEETLKVIIQSKYVIATRFHAMILGWVFRKLVFPIVYSDKMINVIKDTGFNGAYVYVKDLEGWDPHQILEKMKMNYLDISLQVKNSERHFLKLDQFLND